MVHRSLLLFCAAVPEVLQHARTNSIFGSGGGVRDPHQVVAARSRKSLGHVYHQKYSARGPLHESESEQSGAQLKKKNLHHKFSEGCAFNMGRADFSSQ